ncbi:pyruvate, water dikinase [Arthrobacter sp. ov407]|uniref:PEP/pyruvate-binding domain-containing protein n=1 Tax=Arthrobacter sp. ov407 TaxID=1761748 RepID=UPI0008807040|nr:PEP/pyruvate-binding domain-containing protein [Arthrobacter sp. ov407]SDL07001.1 pyruvate, water dikinase [Arthrobacter sp. ov407]
MGSADGRAPDSLVVDLGELGSAPVPLVGGKALNLGKLTAAGFPVPRGFCLTTVAYRKAAPAALDALASGLDVAESEGGSADLDLGELARQAREMIVTAPIPADVDAAVRTAYAALGSRDMVAVRSSATAEDLPFASFAGQQDSFLNISGADAVVESVRRCWASLWTERAVAYRAANGINHREAGLAVVVQDLITATSAGVLFTANPVTGTRTETVINASAGPGHLVASGSVNPDHFVVETATGRILMRSPGAATAGRHRSLTDARIRELTALGDTVQQLFGAPQDMEWVVDAAGKIWVTQSRPITTLYPLPDPAAAEPLGTESGPSAETRVYLCGSLLQGLTRPLTPMGLSVLGSMRNRKGPWLYVNPGLRMYVDLTSLIRNKYGRRYLLRMLPLADGRTGAVIPALLDDPRFGVRERPPRRARPAEPGAPAPRTPGTGGSAARTADSMANLALMVRLIPPMLRAAVRPGAELRRAFDYGNRLEAELVLPEPATTFGRLDHAQRILENTVDGLIQATLPGPSVGYLMLAGARRLLRGIAEPRELEAVLRGLPNNVTTEMDLELWQLAVTIGANAASREVFEAHGPRELAATYAAGALPAVAQTGLHGFLNRYGHRAVAEIDLGMPRWSEKPDHIFGMISNYLHVEDPEQAPDRQFARAEEHAEARIRSLVERTGARSRLRARQVEFCLRRTRQLSGLRELPKFYIILALAEMRRQLKEVGAELARSGSIAVAEDVYFLEFDEVRVGLRGADLKGLVADRRRLYDVELRRRRIPRLLLSDGTDVEAAVMAKSPASDALTGTPASAGTATGTVRVILDPVGAHLEPGEILVAPSTDPGWTPLFMTAGALVMEMGGVISHGAVVAREYGIPAVVGVPDATTRLRTGQRVTVDGSAGTVRQVDAPLSPATAAGSLAG